MRPLGPRRRPVSSLPLLLGKHLQPGVVGRARQNHLRRRFRRLNGHSDYSSGNPWQVACTVTRCTATPLPDTIRAMSTVQLRREIKKAVDELPPERLESLADFVSFLNRPSLLQRMKAAEKEIKAGKGVNWRKVRSDV